MAGRRGGLHDNQERIEVTGSDEDSRFPTDKTDMAISVASSIASTVPWLGGVVSSVLSGYGQTRKLNRIQEVLDDLADRLTGFESKVSRDYVRTEDFEELLEHTLRRVADERNSEVRKLYVDFIHKTIVEPSDDYDAHMDVLTRIERLRAVDVVVLHAMLEEPSQDEVDRLIGSPIQSLEERTGLERDIIKAAIENTDDLRITNLTGSLQTMMTARGAASLQHAVTALGKRVLGYIGNRPTPDNATAVDVEGTNDAVSTLMSVCATHGGVIRPGYALNTRGVLHALIRRPHFWTGPEVADAIQVAAELGYFEIRNDAPFWTEAGCEYVRSLL